MNKSELEVGTMVFLKPSGNNARYRKDVVSYFIKKVGRKYLEVWDGERDHTTIKFLLSNFTQDKGGYIADWLLYFSKQEILDEEEFSSLESFFKNKVFGGYGKCKLTLDQLRKMKDIVE